MALSSRSRLWWWLGAVLVVLVLAAAAVFPYLSRPAVEPFFGEHQSGIATPPQKYAFVAAFDLTTTRGDEVRELLQKWTSAAANLTQGVSLGAPSSPGQPPSDTGEAPTTAPDRLTVTFGVGPSLFDDRFGLAAKKPTALVPLPAFSSDRLNPEWSDGDLVVQVCADHPQTAFHALHTLTRLAQGVAVARWAQSGFAAGRNLEGFLDGTVNPDPRKPEVMHQYVWVDDPSWMKGGSYLVVRRIRMFVETWDRTSLSEQEATIGRDKTKGKESTAMADDSHVRLARGAGVEKILRRPFNYVNGLDDRTGQWDSGLLFLAWMKDPGRQFVPMQTRLSSYDALNEYIRPVGSAVFAVFPGIRAGDYYGSALFPEPTLATRIEGLQAALGGLYPSLAQADWAALRTAAEGWNQSWQPLKPQAGERGAAIEAARMAWVGALSASVPDDGTVRAAQASLVKSLSAWEAEQPKAVPALSLDGLKGALARSTQAAAAGDLGLARKEFEGFQREWTSSEALVRSLDSAVYAQVELQSGAARRALQTSASAAQAALGELARLLAPLQAPRAFTGLDVGLLLFREGLEALLVLGALLAFLGRTGQNARQPWVWSGAALGVIASIAVAVSLSALLSSWLAGAAPTLVEGWTGLAAVVLMLTVGAWLHGKSNVKNWNVWFKDKLNKSGNQAWPLAALAFLAVLREGAETVVFLWGIAGNLPLADLVAGLAGGLAVLAVLGVLMLGFSKRLPLAIFFPLATALIYYLAVKILGQSLGALQSSGMLPSTPLGWGAPIDWLGFVPTWQAAVPQVVLAVVLASLWALPLFKQRAAAK